MNRDRNHDEAIAELFRDDPVFAAEYLSLTLQEGGPEDLLLALRQLAIARGGIRPLAEASGLNSTQLYRMLSEDGNPSLSSLTAVLKALGLRLAVQAAEPVGESD